MTAPKIAIGCVANLFSREYADAVVCGDIEMTRVQNV